MFVVTTRCGCSQILFQTGRSVLESIMLRSQNMAKAECQAMRLRENIFQCGWN